MANQEAPNWQPGIRNPNEVYQTHGVVITAERVPELLALAQRIKSRPELLKTFDDSTATAIAGALPFYIAGKPDTPEWRQKLAHPSNNFRVEGEDFISHEGRLYLMWTLKEIALLSTYYPDVFKPDISDSQDIT